MTTIKRKQAIRFLQYAGAMLVATVLAMPLSAAQRAGEETYVLTLRAEAVAMDATAAAQLAATYGGELVPSEAGGTEYVVRISGSRARLLASDARVASLAPGSGVTAMATWSPGLEYGYDPSGNITKVGGDSYSYDAFNRLAVSTVSNVTRSYTYDAYGNRTACTQDSVACEGAAPADVTTNRMNGLTYDDDGNVKGGGGHIYTYDALNMQTSDKFGPNTRQYVYTANDERIAVYTNNSASWKWTVRGLDNKVLREFTSANGTNGFLGTVNWTWSKDYVWRDALLLATRQPVPGSSATTTYSYHLDHLGTERRARLLRVRAAARVTVEQV